MPLRRRRRSPAEPMTDAATARSARCRPARRPRARDPTIAAATPCGPPSLGVGTPGLPDDRGRRRRRRSVWILVPPRSAPRGERLVLMQCARPLRVATCEAPGTELPGTAGGICPGAVPSANRPPGAPCPQPLTKPTSCASTRCERSRSMPSKRPSRATPAAMGRAARLPAVDPPPELQPGRPGVARPRPLRALGRPRLHAALLAAAPHRLRPAAGGAEALPPVG